MGGWHAFLIFVLDDKLKIPFAVVYFSYILLSILSISLSFWILLTSEQENTKYSRTNHISLSLRRTKVHRVSIGKHSGSRDRKAYACKSAQHDRDQYHPGKWAVFLPKLLRHHAFLLPAFQCFFESRHHTTPGCLFYNAYRLVIITIYITVNLLFHKLLVIS